MKKTDFLFASAMLLTLTGCAGEISAWKNSPIKHHSAYQEVINPTTGVKEEVLIGSIMTTTGDRRTILNMKGGFCAEAMPDAVAVFTGSSKVKVGVEKYSAESQSGNNAAVLQTYQPSENDGIVRQLGWNACLARAQGWISEDQYFDLLKMMMAGGVEVMKIRASQPLQVRAPAQVNLASPNLSSSSDDKSLNPAPTPTPTPTTPPPVS